MLTKDAKQKKMTALETVLSASDVLIIAENTGLSAAEMAELRAAVRARGGQAQVVKNTLARRALVGGRFQSVAGAFIGPLIYGTGGDAAAVAKAFVDAADKNPKLVIRGGALPERECMDGKAVAVLARLPGREQLLAHLAATLQAPLAALARTLNEVPAGLARALAAVRGRK